MAYSRARDTAEQTAADRSQPEATPKPIRQLGDDGSGWGMTSYEVIPSNMHDYRSGQ